MMLGSECGGFQHIITKHPTDIVTIVVDCEDYSIPQVGTTTPHNSLLYFNQLNVSYDYAWQTLI